MIRLPFHRTMSTERRGTTVVETAIVLPVFLIFVLSLIEFGHALMVNNVLRSATRAGARMGATEGRSSADVSSYVTEVLSGAIRPEAAEVTVKDATVYDSGGSIPQTSAELDALPNLEVLDADARQLFMVRARVAYNDIALVPMTFMNDVVLEGQAFIRHE